MNATRTAHTVGLLDRTGQVLQAARGLPADLDLVEFLHIADLDDTDEDVDVLVVGSKELTAAGLRRIGRFATAHPATVIVAHVLDGSPDRLTLRSGGVTQQVRGALTARKLTTVINRADVALTALAAATQHLQPLDELEDPDQFDEDEFDAPADQIGYGEADDTDDELDAESAGDDSHVTADAPPAAARAAFVITVASATGGCGKTFYATNLAGILATHGLKVLLVDLDLQFGEVAAALQVNHPFSVYDGLYNSNGERLPRAELAEHLDELVAHHKLGFDVLTAPRDPGLADYIGARDATAVIDAVVPRYDVVITDTPPSINDVVIAALDRSDHVLCLASLDVPSLRNLSAFLDVLRRLGTVDNRVELLLNKTDTDVGVTIAQAQETFKNRFTATIPYERTVSRSINLGTTVVAYAPRTKVSKALQSHAHTLLSTLLADRVPAANAQANRNAATTTTHFGWLRRLRPGGIS